MLHALFLRKLSDNVLHKNKGIRTYHPRKKKSKEFSKV
jgi:hypothetical protein